MVDDNMIAITITCIAGNSDSSISRSVDRSSFRRGKIETRMELYTFIDRVNAITKTRSNATKIFVAHGLNSRGACKQLFLVFFKAANFTIGVFLGVELMSKVFKRSV